MELNPSQQRSLASDLFNQVWTLLEKPDRSADENDRMIHAAHASRFLWEDIGNAQNHSIGEWQISRVYAVFGRAEPALFHARRSLHWATEGNLPPFYVAYAHEALARAHSIAGNMANAAQSAAQAQELASGIEKGEDREALLTDLKTIPMG